MWFRTKCCDVFQDWLYSNPGKLSSKSEADQDSSRCNPMLGHKASQPPSMIESSGAQGNCGLWNIVKSAFIAKIKGISVWNSPYLDIQDIWNWWFIIRAVKTPLTLSVHNNETKPRSCWFSLQPNAPDLRPCHLLATLGCLSIYFSPIILYPNYRYPPSLTWNSTFFIRMQSVSLRWTLKIMLCYSCGNLSFYYLQSVLRGSHN